MSEKANLYEKIQLCKLKLSEANLKKSGSNKFAGFNYFELKDFLPEIVKICNELKLFTQITFSEETATLTIIDSEKPEDSVSYTSPMRNLELKGCNAVQALGGVETYQRRYLYMAAFDIVEDDVFDATTAAPQKTTKQPQQTTANKATSKQIQFIKQQLNSQPDKTTELLDKLGVSSVSALTVAQANAIIKKLIEPETASPDISFQKGE